MRKTLSPVTLRPAGRLTALLGLLSFGLAIVIPTPAPAQTTYHVATKGSDTNPGTSSQPFRSVQRAVDTAKPGDTILVHAGVYGGADIKRSGAPGKPITLRAAGDGPSILRENLAPRSCRETAPASDRTIQIRGGQDYWTIEGLTVDGGIYVIGTSLNVLGDRVKDRNLPGRGRYDPAAARKTIESLGADPADGIQILNNSIRGRGIYVAAGRDGRIEGNEIFDIDCGVGAAIWLNRFSDNWVIRKNYIHDVAASDKHWMSEGIRMGGASMYNIVEENVVERLNGLGRGIATDVHAGWNKIRKNRVREADQGFSEQYGGWGNQWVENVAENNRRMGFNIFNNGSDRTSPDGAVPAYLEVRCNKSVNNPTALNIGAVQSSKFERNAVPLVKLSRNVSGYWSSVGNTWDGNPTPPPSTPPALDCSSTLPPPPPAPARRWGDVNKDGSINSADALVVLSHVAGLPVGSVDLGVADVTADSKVTSSDALVILYAAVGLPTAGSRVGTTVN